MIVLDGAIGTALLAAGLPEGAQGWTAWAARTHPTLLAGVHRHYADAGATHHTANTFRTRQRDVGPQWQALLQESVALCRSAVPAAHTVLGSLAPVDDCYTPTTPAGATRAEHRRTARALGDAGVDILLCETFTRATEAWVATEEAVATGMTVWTSLCPGIDADAMSPNQLRHAAEGALERGATLVLVNCVGASRVQPFANALRGLPFGVYANAGHVHDGVGWGAVGGPERYAELARGWADAGARVIGGCCGTAPEHIAALARYLPASESA